MFYIANKFGIKGSLILLVWNWLFAINSNMKLCLCDGLTKCFTLQALVRGSP